MPQEKRLIENKHCSLLSLEENQHISRLLGTRCKTLATTIIQLFHTQPPSHQQWLKRDTGVLCFVRDSIKKNYFFRLFCLRRNCMTWEQEMYNGMVYSNTCPYLHTFEGDESMIAFNFVSEEEANELYKIVTTKLLTKKKREEQSSANNIIGSSLSPRNKSATLKPTSFSSDPEAKKAKRKRNITKADIGQPLEFRHISHIGWDRDKGFAFNTEDKQLHEFFHKAGVSEKHLQDTETRNFIYDFIQKNGGRDAVERNITKKPPPPPTTAQTGPPVPPRGGARTVHNRAAPPPPSATPPRPQPQPPRGIMGGIPPPPPGNAPPPPPGPPLNGSLPLPPLGGSSAPPPPPPPPPLTELPPPVVAPSINDSPGDLRSALFDSIREGTTLKPVDSEQKNNVTRDDVFSDIRKGVMLKPVGEREIKPPTPNNEGVDLADALKRALVERNRVIHPDDDDDDDTSDTNSNDEEWE